MKQQKNGRLLLIGLVIAGVLTAAFLLGGQNASQPSVPRFSASSAETVSSEEASVKGDPSKRDRLPFEAASSLSESSSGIVSPAPLASDPEERPSRPEELAAASKEETPPSSSQLSAESPAPVQSSVESAAESSAESSAQPPAASSEESPPERPAVSLCTLRVRCNNALSSPQIRPEVLRLLPKDGVIIESSSVSFQPGESAFDVLRRECMARRIHLDFSSIPLTGGVYVKGIHNLYEFDCGSLSGWMISVNGEFLKSSCSDYLVSEGDEILYVYTCDLGKDVGNEYMGS